MHNGPIPPITEGQFLLPEYKSPKPTRITTCHEKRWRWDTHEHVLHPSLNEMVSRPLKKKSKKKEKERRSLTDAKHIRTGAKSQPKHT